MLSLLLAIDPTQIVLIVLIVALIIIYPVMMYVRNKKQRQQMQEQTNSLKRGDKVLTTSGVYGTIVDLHLEGDKTIVTLETGEGKNKGYISFDAYAIYSIIREEESSQEIAEENKPQEIEKIEEESVDVSAEEVASEEVVNEEKSDTQTETKSKRKKKEKKN